VQHLLVKAAAETIAEAAAETIAEAAEIKKGEKQSSFFISVQYELREIGELPHLEAIGFSQHSCPISFGDNNS